MNAYSFLLPVIASIIGTFLTYIFIIPVLQNRIKNLEDDKKSQKLNIDKLHDDISENKTKISLLENNNVKINKLIDELFQTEKENNDKFQIMIQKNTEAIIKLEATLQNLNEHTKKLDDFFTKFLQSK
jgi:hypothetical protein